MFRSKGALYLSVAVAGVAVGIMLTPFLSKSIPNIFDPCDSRNPGCGSADVRHHFHSFLFTHSSRCGRMGDVLRYE